MWLVIIGIDDLKNKMREVSEREERWIIYISVSVFELGNAEGGVDAHHEVFVVVTGIARGR